MPKGDVRSYAQHAAAMQLEVTRALETIHMPRLRRLREARSKAAAEFDVANETGSRCKAVIFKVRIILVCPGLGVF